MSSIYRHKMILPPEPVEPTPENKVKTFRRWTHIRLLLAHVGYVLFALAGGFLNPFQVWPERFSFALLWVVPGALVHSWALLQIKRRVERWSETGR